MKLTKNKDKLTLRDADYKNAIKGSPFLALGLYFIYISFYRFIFSPETPLLLGLVGLLLGLVFTIFGVRLIQIAFAVLVKMDRHNKAVSIRSYRFLKKKVSYLQFDEVDGFTISPGEKDEIYFDLKLKDSKPVEIVVKNEKQLPEMKQLVQKLNAELRK